MIAFRGLDFKFVFNRAKPFDTKVKQLSRNSSWNPFYSYSYPDFFFPFLFALLLSNKKKMFLLHFEAEILDLNQLNG